MEGENPAQANNTRELSRFERRQLNRPVWNRPPSKHINELPDVVIISILSHIPARYRCTTSVVCRRWYNLQPWNDLTTFDISEFDKTDIPLGPKKISTMLVEVVPRIGESLRRLLFGQLDFSLSHELCTLLHENSPLLTELSGEFLTIPLADVPQCFPTLTRLAFLKGVDDVVANMGQFHSFVESQLDTFKLYAARPGELVEGLRGECVKTLHYTGEVLRDETSRFEPLLSACPSITDLRLHLTRVNFLESVLAAGHLCRNITHFSLNGVTFNGLDPERIEPLMFGLMDRFRQLESLELSHVVPLNDFRWLANASPSLKALKMNNSRFRPEHFNEFPRAVLFGLEVLSLEPSYAICDEGLEALIAVVGADQPPGESRNTVPSPDSLRLKELRFGASDRAVAGGRSSGIIECDGLSGAKYASLLESFLKYAPQLDRFTLSDHTSVGDDIFPVLLKSCPSLEHIDLRNTVTTPEGFDEFIRERAKVIKERSNSGQSKLSIISVVGCKPRRATYEDQCAGNIVF